MKLAVNLSCFFAGNVPPTNVEKSKLWEKVEALKLTTKMTKGKKVTKETKIIII